MDISGPDSFILGKRRHQRRRNSSNNIDPSGNRRRPNRTFIATELTVSDFLCPFADCQTPEVECRQRDEHDVVMSSENEETSKWEILSRTNVDIKGTSVLTEPEHGKGDDVTLDEYTEYYKTLLRCIMVNAANHIRLVCIVMWRYVFYLFRDFHAVSYSNAIFLLYDMTPRCGLIQSSTKVSSPCSILVRSPSYRIIIHNRL